MSLDFYLHKAKDDDSEELYWRNITHNLNKMAEAAGIYKALWRPEEINAIQAKDIIGLLEIGLTEMKLEPDLFKELNPSNGWGSYHILIDFVETTLDACREYPDSYMYISR